MLGLSDKFQLDIQSKQTNITPLIVIDNDIYISTVKGLFNGDIFWEDYNLSIPSINDSINIKTKTIQINKLSFTLSNFPINGKRFSDFVYERGLLNKFVDVYYKTQSCTTLDDCLIVFRGTIRKLDHDSKRVKIELEDLTEDVLKKKVPIANTGYTNHVYNEEYLNTPIPIVYGEVDKAPAIPYIDKENSQDEVSIRIVCDAVKDVVDADRNIQLMGISNVNNEYLSSLELNDNPLYIHKDSYFQVLKNYNHDIISGSDDNPEEDWEWNNEEQYTVNGSVIEIRKKHEGIVPQNPPAFNELQCVKLRFPNQCMLMTNDLVESETDDEGYLYKNISVDILNPEFAIDNPFNLQSSSNINPYQIGNDTYYDTRAQIPNNELEDVDNEYLYNGFRLHQYDGDKYGIYSTTDTRVVWGHFVYQWLYLYSHLINEGGYENPKIVFKQFPSMQGIQNRLKEVINQEIMASIGTLANVNYSESSNPFGDIVGNQPHFVYEPDTYSGEGEVGTLLAGDQNGNWFNDQYQETGTKTPCPQPFFYYQVISDSIIINTDLTGALSIQDFYGYQAACVTMNNNTIDMANPMPTNYPNVAKAYNLFNLGDGHPYLFEPEEFEEFVPYELTNSFQAPYSSVYGAGRQHYRSFGVKQTQFNAYGENSNYFQDNSGMEIIDDSTDSRWFGGYGLYLAGWREMRTRTYDIFKDKNHYWVLWVKQDIDVVGNGGVGDALEDLTNYGHPYQTPFDTNMDMAKGKIVINANTIFPNTHRGHTYSNESDVPNGGSDGVDLIAFGSIGSPMSAGEVFNIHDFDEDSSDPDRRLSLIFPLGDLNISEDDTIRTDTFFHGKIKCFFSEETDNSTDKNFILSIAPVDVVDFNLNEIIDYDAMNLINKPLSQCINAEQWWSSDPQDYPSDDNDLNNANSNYTDTGGLARLDYFDPATYTSLNLTYRVDVFDATTSAALNPAILSTDINSVGLVHYICFKKALDSPFYVDVLGRAKEDDEGGFSLIENPAEIITDFLDTELDYNNIDENGLQLASSIHIGHKYGFSINEIKKGKEFIEELSKDTKLMPKFKGTSEFTYCYIRDNYGENDITMTINTSDIIKYNFTRTQLQNINTIVNVKYKKDYAEDEYTRETGYVDGYDMFGNGDGIEEVEGRENGYSYEYLGLSREDKVLEYESNHIRDEQTALALRNFLYMYNCNQHNTFKLDLPIKYINLESGDIIKFDNLIENIKAYGEDYTAFDVRRNGQLIYPYFIITKIRRKLKGISLDCVQLHDLSPTFDCSKGSITRMSSSSQLYLSDFMLLERYFIQKAEKYFTRTQKYASDINSSGIITQRDLDDISSILGLGLLGDNNLDGSVNVTDIVALVNTIISGETSDAELLLQDVNQDGFVNVTDIIEIINMIIGDS